MTGDSPTTDDGAQERLRQSCDGPEASSTPRRVLIAGCGYLGCRAAALWVERGSIVFALTRSNDKASEFRRQGLEPIVAELSGHSVMPRLPDVDCVLWAVGFDRTSGQRREDVWQHGFTRLAESLSRESAPRRLIFVSSTSVYGDSNGGDVDERAPTTPETDSGQSVLAAEQHALDTMRRLHPATDVVRLRMAGIYGPDRLLRRVSDLRARIPISAAPDEWLNLIHVEDAARVCAEMAGSFRVPALNSVPAAIKALAVINVVNRGTLTRSEYYSCLAELAGTPAPVFAISGDSASVHSVPPPGSVRGRSGHRRIVSRVEWPAPGPFHFDDVRSGLANAVARTIRAE